MKDIYKKCIYCLEVDCSSSNWPGEHVFPKLLGCPDQFQLDTTVCKDCNNQVFSKLEDSFKQHTPEGYIASIWKLGRGGGYRTTGQKLTVRIFQDAVEVPPYYLYTGDLKAKTLSLEPQTILIANQKRINLRDKQNSKKLTEAISWMKSKQIEEITLSRPQFPLPIVGKIEKLRFELTAPLDLTVQRLIAKMAFNYFAYCSLPEYDSVVYDNWFSPLRKFVLTPSKPLDPLDIFPTSLVEVSRQATIQYDGKLISPGQPYHYFRIARENLLCYPRDATNPGYYDCLVVYINLFSLVEYRVRLSFFPFSTYLLCDFGVSHVIDLQEKKFIRVQTNGEICSDNNFKIIR